MFCLLSQSSVEILLRVVEADSKNLAASLGREIMQFEIVDALVGDDVHVRNDVLGDRLDEQDVALLGRDDLPAFRVAERDGLELLVFVEDDHG